MIVYPCTLIPYTPMPIQVVMTANKEAVLSEKELSAHFGQTLLVGYSETIHPKVRALNPEA